MTDPVVSQYQALLEVSESIAIHRDPRDLFRELARSLHRVVHFDFLLVVLHDDESGLMRLHVLETARPLVARPPGPLAPDDTPAGWAWERQEPLLIADISRETRWRPILDMLEANHVRCTCYLPLTTAHRRLGALGFGTTQAAAYEESDIAFMQQVAAQVAVAIDNAENYGNIQAYQEELARERDRLKTLLEASQILNSDLDGKEIFTAISECVRRVIQHEYASLVLIEEGSGQLRVVALEPAFDAGALRENALIPMEGSPAAKALETGEPLRVDEQMIRGVRTDIARTLEREGIRAGYCLPLITRHRKVGVLNVGSRRPDAFPPSDLDFLMQLAAQVAIALDNMRAFREIAELKDRLAEEKLYLEDELRTQHNFREMVGDSAEFQRVLRQIETVAPTNASVLILGETGTGKELVARAIHELSGRQNRTFVKLNCSAIPTGLLESELFGHEKGAFTGAIAQKIGRFELAHQGTLFLDEVGDIPLELQPKLLRALQEQEFERLGGTRTIRVDARVVAATNRNLEQMIADREFRSDLFYRLNVFPVRVPPLRERRGDIPLLVRYFAQKHSRQIGRNIRSIPTETMEMVSRYHWPGNIRELENLIERAVILSPGTVLQIPLSELKNAAEGQGSAAPLTLEEAERDHIVRVLGETSWVLSGPHGAAVKLGMKRTTLQSRMKKLGIRR